MWVFLFDAIVDCSFLKCYSRRLFLKKGDGKVEKKGSNKINSGPLCDTVRHLPTGFGKGELALENGIKIKIPLGRVVRKKETQGLVVVLESVEEKNGEVVVKDTFPANTPFVNWEQDPLCDECTMICDENCEERQLFHRSI